MFSLWWELLGFTLSNFQTYHPVILSMVFMFYILSSVLTYLLTGSVYLLTTSIQFSSSLTPALVSTFCFLYLGVQGFVILVSLISEIIQYLSFCVWLISFSIMPSKSTMLSQMARLPAFLWLNHIILCIHIHKHAAAAKSLQSCPTLCDPIDGSHQAPVPGILQARTLEWVAISFSNAWKWKMKVKLLSRVRLLATPWTAAHQAPPSMGFSRQEH